MLAQAQALVREPHRCGSSAGRSSRAPSTRPGSRARRCAPSTSSGRCWPEQLGIDPGPDVVALEQAILRQDPSWSCPRLRRRASATCPWQGLRAYDVEDADWFFGRDGDVGACLEILRATSSSPWSARPARASPRCCAPACGRAAWTRPQRSWSITPGPPTAWRRSPRSGHAPSRTVLVVDQAEEVFTLCEDPEERREFLDSLADEAAARTVSWPCAPTGWPTSPRTPASAGWSSAACTWSAAWTRRPARGRRRPGPPGRAAPRARPGRPPRPRGPRRPRRAAAAVPRAAGDLAAPRGQHPHRRRLPRDPAGSTAPSPSRPNSSTRESTPTSDTCCATWCCAWSRPDRGRAGPHPGAAPAGRHRPRARAADRAARRRPAGHQRRRRPRDHPRGPRPRLAPAARLARRRRRGPTDPAPPQRPPPTPGTRSGARTASSTAASGWPGRWTGRTAREPALTDAEREFLAAARTAPRPRSRAAAERARAQARLIRRLRIVLGGAAVLLVLALVAGGFAAVQSNRAGRNAATRATPPRPPAKPPSPPTRGGSEPGPSSPTTSASRCCSRPRVHGWTTRRRPGSTCSTALAKQPHLVRSAPPGGGYLEAMDVSPDGRWIASSDDQNRMHLYDAATNRLLRSYDAGRPSEDEQAFMIAAFSPDSRQLAVILTAGSPPSRCACWTRTPCSRRRSSTSPAASRSWGSMSSSAPTVATWPPPCTRCARRRPCRRPGYAVVWDLRSPSSPPSGCRPASASRGWRSARTAGPCTPAGR